MKRRIVATAALPAIALALAACSGPAADQAANADNADSGQTELTLAMVNTSCLLVFPAYVAQEQGLFEEAGLDVTIEKMNGSAAVLQTMLAGQADLGMPGATPVILSQASGEDITYVANLKPGGSFALVTPEDGGATSAADLAGKTIGVATSDGSEVSFVHAVMSAEGIAEEDYEILVVGEGGQAVAGFEREDIDAYAASMDGVATIEYAGIGLNNVTGDATRYIFGNGLAATSDFIENQGEAIEAFGNVYREAQEMGFADHDVVLETCEQHQPQEVEDPGYASAMLDAVEISMTPPEGVDYGYQDPEHWQKLVDDVVASGDITEADVVVEELFTNDFVEGYNE